MIVRKTCREASSTPGRTAGLIAHVQESLKKIQAYHGRSTESAIGQIRQSPSKSLIRCFENFVLFVYHFKKDYISKKNLFLRYTFTRAVPLPCLYMCNSPGPCVDR